MQIKHIPVRTASVLPKGLLQYVDRGTLELCLHLIVLSLSLVSASVSWFHLHRIGYTLLHLLSYLHRIGYTHYGSCLYMDLHVSYIVVVLINSFLHPYVLISHHIPSFR